MTRCNRLLRSISSRIAVIRRLVENFDGLAGSAKASCQVDSPAVIPAQQRAEDGGFLACEQSPRAHDPDWMPSADRVAAGRTYGGRRLGRRKEGPGPATATAAGVGAGAALRTPFLRKLLRPDYAGVSPLARPALCGSEGVGAGVGKGGRKSKQLPLKPSTSLGEAHRSLVSAFGQFLSNTAPPPPTVRARRGAGSFRAMCLRQVPRYIEAEQAWREEEEEDEDGDAVSETYALLESFGHGDVAGHADLREVVRADGVKMITRLVEEGMLGDGVVRELVEVCKNAEAVMEGLSILRSWAGAMQQGRGFLCSRRLGLLVEASLKLDSEGLRFTLRFLADLLSEGKVVQSQLDRTRDFWARVLYVLAEPASRMEVMRFLEAYLQAPATKEIGRSAGSDTRQHDFLWNLATLLTAMSWMQTQDSAPSGGDTNVREELQRLLQRINQNNGLACGLNTARPIVLSTLLSNSARGDGDGIRVQMSVEAMLDLLLQDTSVATSSRDAEFLPEVARVIGHIDQKLAFEVVKSVVVELAKTSSQQSDVAKIDYLKRLAIEGGRKWAETRDDMESFDWAEGLDELFHQSDVKLRAMRTPASREPTKYRWEAGMCEWIRATPFVRTKHGERKRSESLSSDDLEDSGICMPSDGKTRKRKRSSSDVDDEDEDEDLEERDELSMATPELNRLSAQRRLREQRMTKAPKIRPPASGKENARPVARGQQQHAGPESARWDIDDTSEDELGM